MPRAASTPCNKIGCSALTRGRYCELHKAVENRRQSNERGYDSRWRRLSVRYRKANPLCETCKARGDYIPVDLVDHIVPVHVAPERIHDEDNLQSLCRGCHADKTAGDLLRYGSATTHGIQRLKK